jgi:MscS family membrane protein
VSGGLNLIPSQPVLNDLLNALIIFAVAWIISRVARVLFATFEKRLTTRTKTELDDTLLHAVRGPIGTFIWLMGLKLALQSLNIAEWGIFTGTAERIGSAWETAVDRVFFVLLTLVVIVLIVRSFNVVAHWYGRRFAQRTDSLVDDELVPLIQRLFQVLVWAVAIIVVFDRFGIGVSSLVVTLGAGSLAFALAAQETLSNMIGGFVIFVDRPVRIGDRVLLENGVKGDVQEIGLRSTKILTFENTIMVVPNAQIVKEKVTNLSYPDPKIRVMVDFGVAYGADLERVKRVVADVARAHPKVLEDPAPVVYFLNFGDSSLDLRLVARTAEYKDQWDATEEVRMGIWKALAENEIEVPFPQRDLWLRNWPDNGPQSG